MYITDFFFPAKMHFLGNKVILQISRGDCCNKMVSRAYVLLGNGRNCHLM